MILINDDYDDDDDDNDDDGGDDDDDDDNDNNNDNNDKNKRPMRPHERLPYTRDHVYIYGNSSLLTAAYVPGT